MPTFQKKKEELVRGKVLKVQGAKGGMRKCSLPKPIKGSEKCHKFTSVVCGRAPVDHVVAHFELERVHLVPTRNVLF